MRVLVIGIDTPVGHALEQLFTSRSRDFVGLNRSDCRWKSERQAKKALRRSDCDIAIDLRIQASADGGVKVHEVDVERSTWLARAAQGVKVPFIHLSCVRVFKGDREQPYGEDDVPNGESSISQLLIAAEEQVRQLAERHIILRMGPVFAPHGINVLTHMLRELGAGEALTLDTDHTGSPVDCEDAAWVISALVDQLSCGVEDWGNYHYCGADTTSCYEFGEVLLAAASQYLDVGDDRVQQSKGPIRRNRELVCERIRNTFAIKRQPWRASVAGHVKEFYAQEAAQRVESN